MGDWNSQITNQLLNPPEPKKGVQAGGIYDLAGNPWAYSDGFAAQVAEVKCVSDAMASDATLLAGTGVVVAGVKYMYVRGDKEEVYARKGNSGVVFNKCNTCIIVAYHDDTVPAGMAQATAGAFADHLKDSNI